MQALVEIGPIGRIVEVEPNALKKEGYRSRSRMRAEVPVRPRAQPFVTIRLAVGADQRREFRLRRHPMLHLPGNGDGAVGPHEPRQYGFKISSPIRDRLASAPEGAGKLGVREPIDSWVTQTRDTQCFDRVGTLRPTGEFPKQQKFGDLELIRKQFFITRLPHALYPIGDLDSPRESVHQFWPRDAVGAA